MLGYGIWRLVEAALDLDGAGDDAKGWTLRSAHLLSGLIHLGLATYAVRLLLGGGSNSREGESGSAEQAAGWALDLPGGYVLIGLLSAGLIATGLFQFYDAWKLKFCATSCPAPPRRSGSPGSAASVTRARVVFALVGLFFWNAASTGRESEAGGNGRRIDLAGRGSARRGRHRPPPLRPLLPRRGHLPAHHQRECAGPAAGHGAFGWRVISRPNGPAPLRHAGLD
jgi:hypothetical protein